MQFGQLAEMTSGKISNDSFLKEKFMGVSIDSRTIGSGELFVAIKGEKQDGHHFAKIALTNKAKGMLAETNHISLNELPDNFPVVTVADTHRAMIIMAENYRAGLPVKIAAITGSNGKTTTKEFAFSLLSAVEEKAYRSEGNLNNLYGLPLSLFRMPSDTKSAIFELGISTKEEMPKLTKILKPDFILITNIGAAHLETFKTVEEVADAKLKLISNSGDDVPVIVNADDELLISEVKKMRKDFITFGLDKKADFNLTGTFDSKSNSQIVKIQNNQFLLPYVGKHHLLNFLAAYALVKTMGYDFNQANQIDTKKIKITTEKMRGELLSFDNLTVMADCYNSNPESLAAGLDAFAQITLTNTKGRRLLIIGDMLELGESSYQEHYKAGKNLLNQNFDLCILIGSEVKAVLEGAKDAGVNTGKFSHYEKVDEFLSELDKNIKSHDLVYLKGSRGVSLDKIMTGLSDARGVVN